MLVVYKISVTITAKLTSDNEAKAGEGDMMPEPDSWFQKKKKAFEKGNRRARKACRKAVKSQGMFWLIISLVFLNTCVLATEHYRQPAWLDDFQVITNLFFVVLFTFEMFLKMYSLGFQVSFSLRPISIEQYCILMCQNVCFCLLVFLFVSDVGQKCNASSPKHTHMWCQG